MDKNQLFSYISTVYNVSGPCEPAKTKQYKTMTQGVMKPVSGPQDRENWDHRKYEGNGNLAYGRKFMTLEDIVRKVKTEAVSNTEAPSMRLDLRTVSADHMHCKLTTTRHGNTADIELLYPNENEQLSVMISIPGKSSKLYAVDIAGDTFRGNFGYSIIRTIDEMIDEISDEEESSFYGSSFVSDFGNNLDTLDKTIVQPSALIRESVDWHLDALKRVVLEAENDMGADDVQQAAGAEQFQQPADSGEFNEPMKDPSAVNADDDSADDEDESGYFKDFALGPDGFETKPSSIYDNIATIIADRTVKAVNDSDSGLKVTRADLMGETAPIPDQPERDLLDAFIKCFPDINDAPIKKSEFDAIHEYLRDSFTGTDAFVDQLPKLAPTVYDTNGSLTSTDPDSMVDFNDAPFNNGQPDSEQQSAGQNDGGFADFGGFIDQANSFAGSDMGGGDSSDVIDPNTFDFENGADATEQNAIDNDQTVGAAALPNI